jgi:hypothetical protein
MNSKRDFLDSVNIIKDGKSITLREHLEDEKTSDSEKSFIMESTKFKSAIPKSRLKDKFTEKRGVIKTNIFTEGEIKKMNEQTGSTVLKIIAAISGLAPGQMLKEDVAKVMNVNPRKVSPAFSRISKFLENRSPQTTKRAFDGRKIILKLNEEIPDQKAWTDIIYRAFLDWENNLRKLHNLHEVEKARKKKAEQPDVESFVIDDMSKEFNKVKDAVVESVTLSNPNLHIQVEVSIRFGLLKTQ